MPIVLKNNSKGTLSAGISTGDLSLTLTPGDGAKFVPVVSGDWFWGTLVTAATYATDSEIYEIVKVTLTTGDTFTIERSAEGTTALAFAAGDILEQRMTRQTLLDLSSSSEAIKPRKYLDEFFFAMENTPIFTSTSDILTDKYAPILMGDQTKYNTKYGPYLKFQLEDIKHGTIWDDMSFPTVNDMLTWITANVPDDGSGNCETTIVARPYETIDETIPVVTRMYGLNRFYSALRGKRGYTKGVSHAGDSNRMQTACATIFNGVWGTSLVASQSLNETVWLSNAKKNLYTNPMFRVNLGYRVDFTVNNSQNRQVWDSGNTAFITNTVDTYNNNENTVGWAVMDPSSISVSFFSYEMDEDALDSLSNGGSGLIVCGMQADSDSTLRAVTVKPIGIDQVVVNMPDFNVYDFEMVFFNHQRQSYVSFERFSSIADFSYTDFDPIGGKMRIDAAEWLNAEDNYHSLNVLARGSRWNGFKADTVRFRLRNKATKEISHLSYAGIVTEHEHKISLRQMRIRNFEDR